MSIVPIARVTVTAGSTAESRIELSPNLAASFGLMPGDMVDLCFGKLGHAVQVAVIPSWARGSERVRLSQEVRDRLCIPTGKLHAVFDPEVRKLRLGPVVGVFALRSSRSQTFIGQAEYFRKLVAMGKKDAICVYVFSPQDIHWEEQFVMGRTYEASRWRPRKFPFPDVVYDRIQVRRTERRRFVQEAKARLAAQDVAFLNPGFLDKWTTHQQLAGDPLAQRYLPHTILLQNFRDLRGVMRRYPVAYVKPTDGSRGVGIWVITRRGHRRRRRFGYQFHGEHRTFGRTRLGSLRPIWRRLRRSLTRRHIIQQGIRLATFRGRPFDIRVLVQKDRTGAWRISSIYVRLGRRGSFRNNLDAGAQPRKLKTTLASAFGRRARIVARRIRIATFVLVRGLEHASDGPLGELGLDIGVDTKGSPWLIEVNSKPVRQQIGTSRKNLRSVRRPLQYARRLAGFVSTG